jgi:cyanophycin synthetase
VFAHFNGKLPAHTREAIEATRLGEESGRLTLFKAANGATILADFAHEKVSLEAISKLAHGLVKGKGRVIGVVRLAHDRTDEQLRETGHIIAEGMDELVVYDKIDGYWRLPTATPDARWPQVVGLTAEKVTKAISEKNSKVTTILREDKAIEYAASIADKNDVVVVIVGNDVPRSVGFIKKSFDATAL